MGDDTLLHPREKGVVADAAYFRSFADGNPRLNPSRSMRSVACSFASSMSCANFASSFRQSYTTLRPQPAISAHSVTFPRMEYSRRNIAFLMAVLARCVVSLGNSEYSRTRARWSCSARCA